MFEVNEFKTNLPCTPYASLLTPSMGPGLRPAGATNSGWRRVFFFISFRSEGLWGLRDLQPRIKGSTGQPRMFDGHPFDVIREGPEFAAGRAFNPGRRLHRSADPEALPAAVRGVLFSRISNDE